MLRLANERAPPCLSVRSLSIRHRASASECSSPSGGCVARTWGICCLPSGVAAASIGAAASWRPRGVAGDRQVNYPIAKARGLHLPGSGGAFRSAVYACAQVPAHPYLVRIRRPVDCCRVGQPTRQRARGTHHLPGLVAYASAVASPRRVARSIPRDSATFCHKQAETESGEDERGDGASSPCLQAGVSAPHIR